VKRRRKAFLPEVLREKPNKKNNSRPIKAAEKIFSS